MSNLHAEPNGSENSVRANTFPLTPEVDNPLLEDAVARVRRIAEEHDAALPGRNRLQLLAAKAVEAELAFFDAALHEPSKEDLERFFGDFVLRALGYEALIA